MIINYLDIYMRINILYTLYYNELMSSRYKISFRTNLKNSRSFQRLHDCLKQLNVKHWAYDFQEYILTLTSDLYDFKKIQAALTSAGCVCQFVKLEDLNENPTICLG